MSSNKPRLLVLILMTHSPRISFEFFLHPHLRSSLRSLLLTMRSYMTLAVLALAASIVSPALSAPIQYDDLFISE